jgi:hypothetical protein
MKLIVRFSAAVVLLLSATGSQAQVDYSDIKVGTQLDGKGIRLGLFIKPVPLPAGDWLVVGRQNEVIALTGGRDMNPTTSQVVLTLKSLDPANGIAAIILAFRPDSLAVNWAGNYCPVQGQAITESYGTGRSSTPNACGTAQWVTGSLKNFIKTLASQPDFRSKTQFGGLAPYANELPDAHFAININARRDKGRMLHYNFFGRLPANFMAGNEFEQLTRTWMRDASQAAMDMLENDLTPMPAFPLATAAVAAAGVTVATLPAPSSALPKPAVAGPAPVALVVPALAPVVAEAAAPGIQDLKAGMFLGDSLALEAFSRPLPLPPGRWLLVQRSFATASDAPPTAYTSINLLLKNTDPGAGIAALFINVNPMAFPMPTLVNKCDGGKSSIVETFGTEDNAPLFACAVGSVYSFSLKERITRAVNGTQPWDRANLAPLAPYADEMPGKHLWLTLRVNQVDQRRLSYTVMARVPPDLKPGHPYEAATKDWILSAGKSLMAYQENKPGGIPLFPQPVAMQQP